MSLSAAGSFSKSNNMNISVSTTNSSGYTLSINSSTGSTALKNGANTITSISSAISESTFSSNSTYNNKWGYKPSQLYNSSTETTSANTDFRPLPGTVGEIIAKTSCANGTSPCTSATDSYTLSIGTRINNQTTIGQYVSDTFVITAVTNSNLIPCDSSKLCLEYDGNGMTYGSDTLNRVNYTSVTTETPMTKYSHTSNVNDAGTKLSDYSESEDTNDVVTIPGANSLHVSLKYGSEEDYDWTSFWEGNYPSYHASDDYESGVKCAGNTTGMYTGGPTTIQCDIAGPSVTFSFYSDFMDVGGGGFGYYAVVIGTSIERNRTVSTGAYAEPTSTNARFNGWSSTQVTPGNGLPSQVEYADEAAIKTNLSGDNGETKTVYAVWQQGYPVTFNLGSNVSSIVVQDSDFNTVGTITSSGQSLILYRGSTYNLKPTFPSGYGTNTITKTTGAGTLVDKKFTVGAGSATINVTSKQLSPIQDYNCSSLSVGSTAEVYDSRDNETYLIGKLADGKCWMLDNLRLDLTDPSVLNSITTSNTHVNAASLTSLKSGNRSAGLQYATSGFSGSNWTNSYSYSVPQITVTGTFSGEPYSKDTVVTHFGNGSGKMGVNYNYCAASAGSFCYGNGTDDMSDNIDHDPDSSSIQDAKYDLCPHGWRMPTASSEGESEALYNAYSSATEGQDNAFRNALSFAFSGDIYNGKAERINEVGYIWTSTWFESYPNNCMLAIYAAENYVGPSSMNLRMYGASVRCVRDN